MIIYNFHDQNQFSGTFHITEQTTALIYVQDENGVQNLHPPQYRVSIIPDTPPSIIIRSPNRQFELDDKSILGIFSTKSGADIERIVCRAVKRMILRSQEFLTVKDLKQAASRES